MSFVVMCPAIRSGPLMGQWNLTSTMHSLPVKACTPVAYVITLIFLSVSEINIQLALITQLDMATSRYTMFLLIDIITHVWVPN
jgi:hypothetical protein